MKKLYVNEEACIGCGACVAIDGAHFDFNDEGLSEVINNENIETEEAKNAISSCPTNAISYIEEKGETANTECEHTADSESTCECENCTCEEECHCDDCNENDNEKCECENCNCLDCKCDGNECHCPGCHGDIEDIKDN